MVESVLNGMRDEMNKCCTLDELNKVYRHGRIWVRITFIIGKLGTKDEAREVNERLKQLRWQRMYDLGYGVPPKFKGEHYD